MRLCLRLLALCIVLLGAHAFASTLVVTESGTFGPSTPVTAYSTPGGAFAYSFDLSSTPAVANVSLGSNFDAAFTNFTYTLNGATTSPDVGAITFFSSADAGLFDVCFLDSCNGGVLTAPGFELVGDQAYTGSEADPTILPGSYILSTNSAVFYAGGGDFLNLASTSPVLIRAAAAATTPEPSSIALLGTGLLAVAAALASRRHA